ncbi:MAG: UDP-2,3-diacylglucosamine diphosphatase LpxI [Hyphomicrobiaceae bacterium]
MAHSPPSSSPIGILAGGGGLPVELARSIVARGGRVHIVGLMGEAESAVEAFPHTWVKWGEVGGILKALDGAACKSLVIIGSVSRPDLANVRLDFGAIRNLPLLLSLKVGGDDSILSTIVRFFESKGLTVLGAHEVAPDLVAPVGPCGRRAPSKDDAKDIAHGTEVVRTLGRLDVGQGAVVARGYVLAVEAAEGTDEMLERAGRLRQWGEGKRRGVLVKMSKPGQELRVDLPTIGPRTVELAARAGLAGLAIEASRVLIAGRDTVVSLADREGLFVFGVAPEGSAGE